MVVGAVWAVRDCRGLYGVGRGCVGHRGCMGLFAAVWVVRDCKGL